MTEEYFNQQMETIFDRFNRICDQYDLRLSYTDDYINELNDYIIKNYDKDKIKIKVLNYQFIDFYNKILLKTDIGTFILNDNKVIKKLKKDHDYNLLEFFCILLNAVIIFKKEDNYFDKNTFDYYIHRSDALEYYLKAYFYYRLITSPEAHKRLYKSFNKQREYLINIYKNCIPLESLNNKDFNSLDNTKQIYIKYLKEIYDNYYEFNNNTYLMFTMIIINNDLSKIDYIKDHLTQFKNFIIEETKNMHYSNKNIQLTYKFIKNNNLLSIFTEEELLKMYKQNPYAFYKLDKTLFLPLAKTIKNESPTIKLSRNDQTLINIEYQNYHLYEDKPIISIPKTTSAGEIPFLSRIVHNNKTIVKLYQQYYKKYLTLIKNKEELNNLQDFIHCLLQPKNLINIYKNPSLTWDDIQIITSFKIYYNDKIISNNIILIKEQLRNQSLLFYNQVIKLQDNPKELEDYLNKIEITNDNVYNYIINNKFLYSKEKGAILKILNNHYDKSLKVLDILILLDEMLSRNLTIDTILKEKEIPKKEFQLIYEKSAQDNPILHTYIFESLSKNKRIGYLKLIKLGYKILNMNITSYQEYQKNFPNHNDIYSIITSLKNTELYPELIRKVSTWSDTEPNKLAFTKTKKIHL